MIIKIRKIFKYNSCLSGFASVNYQENETFSQAGIKSIVYNFVHSKYQQLWGEFVPNLSIFDMLFKVPDLLQTLKV